MIDKQNVNPNKEGHNYVGACGTAFTALWVLAVSVPAVSEIGHGVSNTYGAIVDMLPSQDEMYNAAQNSRVFDLD